MLASWVDGVQVAPGQVVLSGSADDPSGKFGMASLTAAMLMEGLTGIAVAHQEAGAGFDAHAPCEVQADENATLAGTKRRVWDATGAEPMIVSARAREGLGLVPEGRQVFPNLSVLENLMLPPKVREGGMSVEQIYELFPNIKERLTSQGTKLSGGEQQMLAIARALSTNPRLLILDEATEGLAPVIREEIWRCLALLKAQGQTTLVVDKYVERLMALADRNLILERGRITWQGSSAELDARRELWGRYLGV